MWGACVVVGRGGAACHLGRLNGALAGPSWPCEACSPRPIGTTQPNAAWSTLSCMKGSPCKSGRPTQNKALQLTKREYLVGGPASRAIFVESRFAAERRCSADQDSHVRLAPGLR